MPILPRGEARCATLRGWIVVWWLCGFASVLGQGVVLQLKNGDRLSGSIISEDTNRVVISTSWAAELSVPVAEILKRETPAAAATATAPAPVTPAPAPTPTPAPAPVQPKPPKRWFADVQIGANILLSEKEQQVYTGRLKLTYAYKKFRNVFDYLFSYGKTDGVISANRMDGTTKTDFDLGERFYVYNLGGAGYDEIRKVDLRYEVGPGLGYHLWKGPRFIVNVESGINYQAQFLQDNMTIEQFYHRFGEDITWKISPRFSVDEKFEFFPEVGDWGMYRFRFETNLRYLLGNNVTLNLGLIDQYDTRRASDVTRNDLQVHSSLGMKF